MSENCVLKKEIEQLNEKVDALYYTLLNLILKLLYAEMKSKKFEYSHSAKKKITN